MKKMLVKNSVLWILVFLRVAFSVQLAIANDEYDIEEERRYPTPYADSFSLPELLDSMSDQKHTPKTTDDIKDTYDYVIVGSGAGGATVAARLSEKPCVNVLVLEAGKSPPKVADIPGLVFSGTDLDWNFTTTRQEYAAFGMPEQKLSICAGKAVGGSTAINSMLAVRGNREDYNIWAKMGAEGWSYEDVLPYFKKLERNEDYGETRYHGATGPISMEKLWFDSDLKQGILQAANELNYCIVDSNGAKQIGFYDIQGTTRNGQRCGTAKGYLVPAENRPNLDIVANAVVTKVIVEDGQATGVEFDFGGNHCVVRASREVIVSAGALKSPQLLMLSGIGPEEHLNEMGIPVKADLPVGKNLRNHVLSSLNFEVNDDVEVFDLSDEKYVDEYILERTGPLSSPPFNNIAFLQNQNNLEQHKRPDHQIFFIAMTSESYNVWGKPKPEVWDFVYGPYINKKNFSCLVQVASPRSSGYVELQTINPYSEPIINPQYLEDPEDVWDIVEGLKVCKAIANTEAMRKLGAKLFKNLPPDCEALKPDEDKALACLARTISFNFRHPTGTAKMGRVDDPTTVVDPKLRVKGIKRLRVVDASVFPIMPSGNTLIPTIMVAEKAADIIKEDINCD